MERVKSLIPDGIKRMIGESTTEDLEKVSALLLDFLRPLPQFQQVVKELTDPSLALCGKNKDAALDAKQKGNELFRQGDFVKALSFYSQALRLAPATSSEMDENMIVTLYVNRASTLHKLGHLEESVRDCNRAISVSPSHVKAWYRRGKANASLGNYEIARRDLEVAVSIEGNLSRRSQIKDELIILATEHDITNMTTMGKEEKNMNVELLDNSRSIALQCVSTSDKGRGMASRSDIPPASLIHNERPLAAVLLKAFRDSHCHFCFNEAPLDVLFCYSCTIAVYCSENCQEQSGGKHVKSNYENCVLNSLSADIKKHYLDIVVKRNSIQEDVYSDNFPEHRHECGGAHWSAVLPPDVVLAGRIMVLFTERRKVSGEIPCPLDFVHNYAQNPPVGKLEMHVYAIVLLYCLNHYSDLDFPLIGASLAQLVMLLSKIKVNSMAIVHMISIDQHEASRKFSDISAYANSVTSTIEQVRVAQAIYSTGSLFNHSCWPNVHSYFLSRTLYIRTTEFVPAWCPLELSYGPQVGELDLQERQRLLEEQYSFRCKCTFCSELNLSDLVVNAFRCVQPFCRGAVMEISQFQKLENNLLEVSGPCFIFKLSLPISNQTKDIYEVAQSLFNENQLKSKVPSGYCLSCGSYCNLISLSAASNNAMTDIRRSSESSFLKGGRDSYVSKLLNSLTHLKSLRHPYSKMTAQAEDMVANIFVRIGEFELAMQHCDASIEILKKLYHSEHIVVGHELMKLASIQISLGDLTSARSSAERVRAIFSLYYGTHVDKLFPEVKALESEVGILTS